jgi:hypothetical protein
MNVRTTQVPGEPAQYNGWTGQRLLELVKSLETENKRLSLDLERLKLELHNEKGYAADTITTYRCERDDLKALLGRAADALEGKCQNENVGLSHEDVVREFKSFITQLREAAK